MGNSGSFVTSLVTIGSRSIKSADLNELLGVMILVSVDISNIEIVYW